MIAEVGVSISGMPGPPLGPSYLPPHRTTQAQHEHECARTKHKCSLPPHRRGVQLAQAPALAHPFLVRGRSWPQFLPVQRCATSARMHGFRGSSEEGEEQHKLSAWQLTTSPHPMHTEPVRCNGVARQMNNSAVMLQLILARL